VRRKFRTRHIEWELLDAAMERDTSDNVTELDCKNASISKNDARKFSVSRRYMAVHAATRVSVMFVLSQNANSNAHYLDHNAPSRTVQSAVQPRLRAHSRHKNADDSAVNNRIVTRRHRHCDTYSIVQNFLLHLTVAIWTIVTDNCRKNKLYGSQRKLGGGTG
jgi:hypothetical protein